MYSTSDFRKGLNIELDGEPYIIVDFQHVKPGKGGAFVRTKLKSLVSGRLVEKTFRSGEKVGKPDIEEKSMQYLYETEGSYYFMDTESYEQIFLTKEQLGDKIDFLTENLIIILLFFNGLPIGIEVPNFIEMVVAETEPDVRGDTASGGTKPAKLETGAVINVPFFVNIGDKVRIDTRNRTYLERVK